MVNDAGNHERTPREHDPGKRGVCAAAGRRSKPLDTVLSGMPAKQAAAVRDATTGQEMATIKALLASLRNAGIIAK